MELGDLLTLLLGGGLVATITAAVSGIKSLKDGARAREKDSIAELITLRKDAVADKVHAEDVADYWRQWAGTVEYLARQQGVTLPERPAEPVRKDSQIS